MPAKCRSSLAGATTGQTNTRPSPRQLLGCRRKTPTLTASFAGCSLMEGRPSTSFRTRPKPVKDRWYSSFSMYCTSTARTVMILPLVERNNRLAALLNGAPDCLRYNDHQIGHGPEFHRLACQHGVYRGGRESPNRSGCSSAPKRSPCPPPAMLFSAVSEPLSTIMRLCHGKDYICAQGCSGKAARYASSILSIWSIVKAMLSATAPIWLISSSNSTRPFRDFRYLSSTW
jgi:hypothetical protein